MIDSIDKESEERDINSEYEGLSEFDSIKYRGCIYAKQDLLMYGTKNDNNRDKIGKILKILAPENILKTHIPPFIFIQKFFKRDELNPESEGLNQIFLKNISEAEIFASSNTKSDWISPEAIKYKIFLHSAHNFPTGDEIKTESKLHYFSKYEYDEKLKK